jgi:uncharacterized protein YndB with AHSA1/START domain
MAVQLGEMVVHRSIVIKATPERIWEEFTSFDRMAAWWSTQGSDRNETLVKYEPRVGGAMEMRIDSPGQAGITFSCMITAYEPPRELSFDLEWAGAGWAAPTTVSVRLTPNGYGTLVEITHYGFERIGEAALEQFHGFGGGWDLRELESLRRTVEG